MIFIYFSVISTENVPLIFLTSTLITAGTYAMSNAIYPSFFAELFNVRVRCWAWRSDSRSASCAPASRR